MRQEPLSALLRYSIISGIACAALVLLPALQRPAWAQQNPAPYPPPPAYAPPPAYGAPAPSPGYSPGYYDAANATAQAITDAQADTNGTLWFFVGCLGLIGILIAYVAEPTPPPARLLGKSPEYVANYANAYKSAGKSAQGKQAIIGCAVGTAIAVAIYAVIVFAILNDASSMSTAM
jgi:hypothetical protein